jgi:hypothetical protein
MTTPSIPPVTITAHSPARCYSIAHPQPHPTREKEKKFVHRARSESPPPLALPTLLVHPHARHCMPSPSPCPCASATLNANARTRYAPLPSSGRDAQSQIVAPLPSNGRDTQPIHAPRRRTPSHQTGATPNPQSWPSFHPTDDPIALAGALALPLEFRYRRETREDDQGPPCRKSQSGEHAAV